MTVEGDGALERVRRSASTIATLAETNLATVLSETGDGGAEPVKGIDGGPGPEGQWWQAIRRKLRQYTGDADALLDTVASDMRDRLGVIIDSYATDAAELDDARTVRQHG